MKKLHIADTEMILAGDVTDIYFVRTEKILKTRSLNAHVCMEVFMKSLPDERYRWGVFAGLEEVCTLLEGRPVTVHALAEGSVFFPRTPVMTIEGKYLDFGEMETAILGCLCQASGIATRASRFKVAAGNKPVMSFGARRIHPSIAPMVERSAFIGGCDGVSSVAGARLIGENPVGTIPHALVLIMGDTLTATLAFDEIIDRNVPRISLIDTFQDEKFEAIHVAEYMKERLSGIRLDTPSSRRGDFRSLLREVRWELDLRGHTHVRLVVSGGLDVKDVLELADVADIFGVGTHLSGSAALDFSMDIVEIEGRPIAKRGKESGKKSVLRCRACMKDYVVPYGARNSCECSGELEPLLEKIIDSGKVVSDLPDARQIRKRCMDEVAAMKKNTPAKEFLNL